MLNVHTINRYLKNNGLDPDKGYLLKDKGDGVFIARWDLGISEPTTSEIDAIVVILDKETSDMAYKALREDAYYAKEKSGELPATPQDNIDEIWNALEALKASGVTLSLEASAIITHRREIKDLYPAQ